MKKRRKLVSLVLTLTFALTALALTASGVSGSIFFDGFEEGLGNWTTGKGTASRSTSEKHSGSYSYEINENMDVIYRVFGTSYNKVAVIWFYDDASDTSMICMAKVDEGDWDDSYSWVGLGVDTTVSTTKYTKRIGINKSATNITRTTGWHELKWDYTSGTKVDLYIDSSSAGSTTATTSLSKMAMGDWWGDGRTGGNYFDDVEIEETVTPTPTPTPTPTQTPTPTPTPPPSCTN